MIQTYRRSLRSRTRVNWSDQTPAFVRGRSSELEETCSPLSNLAHRGLPLPRRLSTGGRHFQQPSLLFHYLLFLLVLLPLLQHRSLRLSRSPDQFSSQSWPPFRPPPINFRLRMRRRFTSGSPTSSVTLTRMLLNRWDLLRGLTDIDRGRADHRREPRKSRYPSNLPDPQSLPRKILLARLHHLVPTLTMAIPPRVATAVSFCFRVNRRRPNLLRGKP